MPSKTDGLSYPEPYIVPPRGEHKQSIILLHGRGDEGKPFGWPLLNSQTAPSGTLATKFPHAKFIFPSAKKRRAKWYNRATINQWFDNVPIDEQDAGVSKDQEEWQLEGLRQSREVIKKIVDDEVKLVGASNVFIGGLSQGCAMGLHLLLSYEGEKLGGFVGMSGWLPYADAIEEIINPQVDEDGNDLFANDDDEASSAAKKVCNFVRDNMDLPPISTSQPTLLQTPIFLGHGKNDDKVKMAKGQRAAQILRDLGMQVTWKEYDEGHWYKVPEEIDDIVEFLQQCLPKS